MTFIKDAEQKINDIVQRGQEHQMERKVSGETEFDLRKRADYEARMRRNIEQREIELKQYNDEQLRRH